MTVQPRPPWDSDPRYPDVDDIEWIGDVDPRDVETRNEAANAGRLFATIVAIALVFALAFWVASKLAEGAVLAPRSAPAPTVADPGASVSDVAPGGAGTARALGDASGPGLSSAPDVAIAGPLWSGTATWYCGSGSPCTAGYGPSDLVAAIDRSLGIAKGQRVLVRSQAGGGSVTVRIVDVCACGGARLIDLTTGAFQRLAPLDQGVIPVTLEVVGPGPTLPATEAEP